ncbi:agenet domain-containing protein [Forsythia ovata]|uniref:Agenet domain-containing protein n=1 Tax=Forsythia ovata TaxID=205694 RepID=A0ABD1VI63_9LAMI
MASTDEDITAQYFKKGSAVEISSNDEGFRGSWFEGTVIRPPPETTTPLSSRSKRNSVRNKYNNNKKNTVRVLVEYKNLMEDEAGTKKLREELDLVQLRPPPPREKLQSFKFNEEVDAYYNDGWWEGVVTGVLGEDTYSVFFRGNREQIDFKASQLRLHREWVNGKWVPPLEDSPPLEPEQDEKVSAPTELKLNKEIVEDNFGQGALVEVCSDEDGFEGAWFAATVIKKLDERKYLIEYENLRNDDDTEFVREEVDSLHIRPCPPDVRQVDRFEVLDEVDALYKDGWWVGVISKVYKNNKYTVYFRGTNENLKFEHSDLRLHQEWINGKWVIASRALKS